MTCSCRKTVSVSCCSGVGVTVEVLPADALTEVKVDVSPVENLAETAGELYNGSYTVTPDVEPVVLQTRQKVMKDNVTVKEIPLWEVSNQQGGKTVVIGGGSYYHG